ncbi:hypothetical protein [Skermania sp. ID1734]|uniref:hypothetical protein n=1 Tax=Skermania sp. ID1734 TaxID=2597516 RepID=UPI00163D94EA
MSDTHVPGLATFAGDIVTTTDYDFTGKRVAVIASGSNAAQLLPVLVRRAAEVKVFQETPGWVLPRVGGVARRLPRWMPATEVIGRVHLRAKVHDPWLRRQLTPDPRARSAPLQFSNDYYAALQRDNCKLISWPIATVTARGIRTVEGIEHQCDCIVFADRAAAVQRRHSRPLR